MIKKINVFDILMRKDVVFIDVRSEKEFDEDTIPGAINLPILNNKEREYVGYLYKQINVDKAKDIGLEYASSKLTLFYKKIKEIKSENKEVALFCYRGGMRSNSIANVMDTMGLDVFLIEGGYKAYRKYVIESLDSYADKFKFIVLHGYTGVGKTKILKKLEKMNESVLDLEGLARNSGSVFGEIGYENKKISQKKFESELLDSFKKLTQEYVFIESESKRIGKVILPNFLYDNMQHGIHILIKTSINNRTKNIIDDYINNTSHNIDEKIIEAIMKLKKRLGADVVNELVGKVRLKQYEYVAEKLMIDYYDSLYQYSIDNVGEYDKIMKYDCLDDVIKQLLDFKNKI